MKIDPEWDDDEQVLAKLPPQLASIASKWSEGWDEDGEYVRRFNASRD